MRATLHNFTHNHTHASTQQTGPWPDSREYLAAFDNELLLLSADDTNKFITNYYTRTYAFFAIGAFVCFVPVMLSFREHSMFGSFCIVCSLVSEEGDQRTVRRQLDAALLTHLTSTVCAD